jgi:hypothetical protein
MMACRARAVARGAMLAVAFALVCFAAAPAQAQFEVKSPVVEQGVLELEALGSAQWGFSEEEEEEEDDDDDDDEGLGIEAGEDDEEDQRQGYEFSVGYGVTDFWKPELALVLEQRKHRDLKADAIELENTFQVLPTDAYFVNAGLLFAYEASLRDDVHALELGPLLQLPLGRLTNTGNAFFEKQYGDDRETSTVGFEYAWQSVFDIAGGLGLGFEAFGEIEKIANDPPSTDEQEHRIGPVALFEAELGEWGEIGIELGFLFGLTDETPDHTFKFNLEYEWGPEGDEGRRPATTTDRGHNEATGSMVGAV